MFPDGLQVKRLLTSSDPSSFIRLVSSFWRLFFLGHEPLNKFSARSFFYLVECLPLPRWRKDILVSSLIQKVIGGGGKLKETFMQGID